MKHLCSLSLFLATIAVLAGASSDCCAQEDTEIQIPDNGLQDLIPPGSQLPPAIYMLDENGQPKFVPRIPYREFENRHQETENNGNETTPFSFDSVELNGIAKQRYAEFSLTMKLTADQVGEYLEIPIRCRNLIRKKDSLVVEGLDKVQVTFDPELNSQIISGVQTAERISIAADVAVRVDQISDGETNTIDFSLPQAPTSITLDVEQTEPPIATSDSPDSVIVREPQRLDSGLTQLSIDAAGGDFQFRWGTSEQATTSNVQSLEVEGEWQVEWLDPLQSPTIQAIYRVRNLTGTLAPFVVSLPPTFTLSAASFAEVSLEPMGVSDPGSGENDWKVIPAVSGLQRVTLRFQVDVPSNVYNQATPLVLNGINVTDSVREKGSVVVTTSRDFRLEWDNQTSIYHSITRSVQDDRSESSVEFLYDKGDFQLPIWLRATVSGVLGQIDYELSIGQEATEATVIVSLVGTKSTGSVISMTLGQWQLTRVNQVSLLDAETPGFSLDEGTIRLNLDDIIDGVQPSNNQRREVRLTMVRLHEQSQLKLIDFPKVTKPVGDVTMIPGSVRLQPNEGTAFVIDSKKSRGVRAIPSQLGTDSSSDFQVMSPNQRLRLAYSIQDVEPDVRLGIRVKIDLSEESMLCTETLTIEFSEGILSALPIQGRDNESWTATVNQRPAFIQTDDSGESELRFDTLNPGTYDLVLTRAISPPTDLKANSEFEVPICVPVGFAADTPVDVSMKSSVWQLSGPGVLSISQDDPVLQLNVIDTPSPKASLVVENVWLQSLVGDTQRRDRLVARVSGANREFVISLADMDSETPPLRVFVDGSQVAPSVDGNRISISLPSNTSEHIVEAWVWTSHAISTSSIDQIQPEFVVDDLSDRILWQIIAPRDQHAVNSSTALGGLMQWQWRNYCWQRTPNLSTEDLALDFGVSPEQPVGDSNVYLYSSVGNLQGVSVSLAARWMIWFITGGFGLIVSSAFVYIRSIRQPATLLILGFVSSSLAVVVPDIAVMVGQVGILGIGLTAVLLATRRAVNGWPSTSVFTESRSREHSTRSVPTPIAVASTHTLDTPPVEPIVESAQ